MVNGYEITFVDSCSKTTMLRTPNGINTEYILRGLVHSGFSVNIKETSWWRDLSPEEIIERNSVNKSMGYYPAHGGNVPGAGGGR